MDFSDETKTNPAVNKKELVNPEGTEKIYKTMQFSQAVRVGDTVWVSGQVGVDETFNIAEGIEAQAILAFQNLRRIVEAAGGSMGDIVELVTYHKSMKEIGAFSKVKAEFIPKDYPAWTAVGISELVLPGLLVEIRATVKIGSGDEPGP
jgi:enamine deaminase RidA (YjgF/YER057c/UK114 family)